MTRLEHRQSPAALPSEELLPSQRALLALEQPYQRYSFSGLSDTAVNQFGEFLAYDLSLVQDQDSIARGEERSDREHLRRIHDLGILAHKLLRAGPGYDPYEGFDRKGVKITDRTSVKATVQNDYTTQDPYSKLGSYRSENEVFTPQGFVRNPPEDFQQKIVAVDMKNEHIFIEDAVFNFSDEGHLYLYTDNLSAETPFWEFKDVDGIADIYPARHREPYFFHAVPKRIVGEDLAMSVIESLARIFDTSTRDEKQKEADDEARRAAAQETTA